MWAAATANGDGDKVPHPESVRDDIDAMLAATSKPVDPQEAELRRALGVL